MKKSLVTVVLLSAGALAISAQADMEGKLDAKAEFEKHCAACHPGGGNTINQAKPLKREALRKNGIKSWKDIVAKIRNPGPGMTKFDKKEMPDKEARAIAEYVLKTFK
ncbi:c-type cytochrome [Oryzomonas sagensis]|uniref:C-type cytochrome n=1 Tax=Oryzomonas sagensis TaxID=2603857 RepID=A0ABQ6TMM5_9BACT|nr:c-type cytochrome [Oryzomonas sagensis]KAB0669717.1 c-type cytochrome [Oryzomonas sagensis]